MTPDTPRSVLGIDAAWTLKNPSGFALSVETPSGWRLARVAGSLTDFCADVPSLSGLDPCVILDACIRLTGSPPTLIAIDMPLSREPIVARRASDSAVSRLYGSRGCSTHSPSAARPGAISDRLTQGFADLGYPLLTGDMASSGLMEVYPHPALVELTGSAMRLPYKVSNTRKYWPSESPQRRRMAVVREWADILVALDAEIPGTARALPLPSADDRLAVLKGFEDSLDAIICAWVGIEALAGRATALGDETSAIWIPHGRSAVSPVRS